MCRGESRPSPQDHHSQAGCVNWLRYSVRLFINLDATPSHKQRLTITQIQRGQLVSNGSAVCAACTSATAGGSAQPLCCRSGPLRRSRMRGQARPRAVPTDASNALGLSVRRLAINHLVDARWRGLCHALFGSLHTGLGHLRQVLQQSRMGAGGPLREALLRLAWAWCH